MQCHGGQQPLPRADGTMYGFMALRARRIAAECVSYMNWRPHTVHNARHPCGNASANQSWSRPQGTLA